MSDTSNPFAGVLRRMEVELNVQLPRGRERQRRAVEAALRKIRAAVEAIEVAVTEWSDGDED